MCLCLKVFIFVKHKQTINLKDKKMKPSKQLYNKQEQKQKQHLNQMQQIQ